MAKDDSPGLLSKVARFIRHPMTGWVDLDRPESELDSGYDKLALKEMIERKRRNDFVRKREFDQLRKLRRSELAGNPNRVGRSSLFPSSTPSNQDDRAMTLRKIDEIEAQMSRQWWKGKQDEAANRGHSPPLASERPANDATLPLRPARSGKSSAGGFNVSSLASSADFAATQMGLSVAAEMARTAVPEALPGRAVAPHADGDACEFSASWLPAMEFGGADVTDPDLEDAAIRFANGDDVGAEAGLLDALRRNEGPPHLADAWMAALFDLYRATGQQALFDSVAINFAERFGRSAPAWFSIPDLLGRKDNRVSKRVAVPVPAGEPVWISPARLDLQALQTLSAALVRGAASPWYLDWRPLVAMESDAVEALARLFSDWCAQPVRLRFAGLASLEKVLRSATPSGDASVNAVWWTLRMDTLRILRRQAEFDLVALDYCVTYEVSPPSWQEARCEYVYDDTKANLRPVGNDAGAEADRLGRWPKPFPPEDDAGVREGAWAGRDGSPSQDLSGSRELAFAPPTVAELTGNLAGDTSETLGRLEMELDDFGRLVVSCAKLIRVDFSAAGSILNWVQARQAAGCQVQFRDVHRLVAAFFNVIGISEHARVVPRNN